MEFANQKVSLKRMMTPVVDDLFRDRIFFVNNKK